MTAPTVDPEEEFREAVRYATDRLWELGAVEEALAALHDVLDDAARRDEDAHGGQDERLSGP